MPKGQAGFLLLFALTAGLILFLRLFQLDRLQREIYGDIDVVFKTVKQVLAGNWPRRFDLSSGPLYHYLVTPIILLTGLNYAGLKLASVLVSLAGLGATYAAARRLVNDYFALLVTFIAGVSSWLLIFSRLGNSQIVLPLLTMLALWLAVRIVQNGRLWEVAACAFVSGLGLFAYPQSFILPGVIFLTLWALGRTGHSLPRGWIRSFILISGVCLIPFTWIVTTDLANFTGGYIAGKIIPVSGSTALAVLGQNALRALLALHVRGDAAYRSNPSGLPELDWISGVFFLAGIVFWFSSKERRRWVPLWLVPLILLQVPSVLVLNRPVEVPSASRTLGVAPIVYLLVGSGLWWLALAIHRRGQRRLALLVTGLLLAGILFLNTQRYFQNYLNGLPYHDTPIGAIIADFANLLPAGTQVYMVGCCWESENTPDRFIGYDMTRPYDLHYVDAQDLSCDRMRSWGQPAVVLWDPHLALPAAQLAACSAWLPTQQYSYQGWPIFNEAALRPITNPQVAVPEH